MDLKKQLRAFYAHSFLSCARIFSSVWVVLLAARGYSLWEIGIAESVFHIVSLACEVPSGMMADLLGRKRTLLAGSLTAALSSIAMAFAPNLAFVCLSMGLTAFSYTLFSGSEEALIYDSLRQAGRETDYLHVNANCGQLQQVGEGIGALASMLSSVMSFAGFYLTSAAVALCTAIADLFLTEPVVTTAQDARKHAPLRALPARIKQQITASVTCLRTNPLPAKLITASAVVCIPTYLNQMFLQQRLIELGWTTAWLSIPTLLAAAASMLGTELGRRFRPARKRRFYAICAILCGLGTISAGTAPWASAAILGDMLVECILSVWLLHESQWLNDAIPSDQRATIISVDSMAYSLLMIPVSPLVGWLGDITGHAGAGLCALGVCVAASACFCVRRKD